MRVRPSYFLLPCLLMLLSSASAHAAKRIAVLVGSNTGWQGERALRYAENDAHRMGAVLTELGGFASGDVVILDTPRTQELRAHLASAKKKLADEADKESFFVFYYSGHADEKSLHLPLRDEPPFSFEELYGLLREIPATVKLGILDACKSGTITAVKGAKRADSTFDVNMQAVVDEVRGTVVLTSSGTDELSQEDRALAGSFFTHHLVSGLRGSADEDGDSRISLEEAYAYAYAQTLQDTAGTREIQRPAFRKELKGRGSLYLTQMEKPGALLLLPADKRCFVLTEDERQLVAEGIPRKDAGVQLALPAKAYVLKCVTKDKYQVASVKLKEGERLEAGPLQFREVPLAEGTIKGSPSEVTESLGHKLMARAELLRSQHPEQLDLSVLLALESLRRVPSAESRQVLQRGLERLPRAGACVKHDSKVDAAAWSKDGQHVATAAQDHSVRVWNAETGQERSQITHVQPVVELAWSPQGTVIGMRDLQGEGLQWQLEPSAGTTPGLIRGKLDATAFDPLGVYVAFMDQSETLSVLKQEGGTEVLRMGSMRPLQSFSADGRFLAALDVSGKVRVREIATRQELLAAGPTEPPGKVSLLAISPGGKLLALASEGSPVVQLWEVATGRALSLPSQEGPITALAFASAGTLLTASEDKTVRLWEVPAGRELSRMTHEARIETLSPSPDGQWVATTWQGGRSVRIWSLPQGQEAARLVHGDSVSAVAWSPQEGSLATATSSGMACTWVLMGEELVSMPGWGQHTGMLFTPDGQRLITATEDEPARIWEVATGKPLMQLGDTGGVHLLVLSPDGKSLATAAGPLAMVWDVATGKERSRLRHKGFIHSLAFSPDGASVASGSRDGTARVWEVATGTEQVKVNHKGPVKAVAFSPQGKLLATGGEDETARLWELATGKELLRLEHKPPQAPMTDTPSALESVRFSPDGRYLATATLDAVARVWDTESGKELLRKTHSALIETLVFTPDGKAVAIANGEPSAKIWDVVTAQELTSLTSEDGIASLQYSADGKYVLTSSSKGRASLWEASSGRALAWAPAAPDIKEVLLSPDGRYLAMTSAQGHGSHLLYSLHAWQTEDLLQQACTRLRRNLTAEEWRENLGEAETYQKTCPALPDDPTPVTLQSRDISYSTPPGQ
jgi:WD40 repeat protein/uncharacterized caspase-like protein